MRFYVIERIRAGTDMESKNTIKKASEYLKYMAKLEKKGKVIGGPCLDVLANGYILDTKSIEEMGEIFFNSPINFLVDREAHPLAASWTLWKA